METLPKTIIAVTAFAAAMGADIPMSHAFGDAPWCAVISLGYGEIYWDCQYQTVEACVPNVIAGNRGFCNLNPDGPGPAAMASRPPHHKRHHAANAHP